MRTPYVVAVAAWVVDTAAEAAASAVAVAAFGAAGIAAAAWEVAGTAAAAVVDTHSCRHQTQYRHTLNQRSVLGVTTQPPSIQDRRLLLLHGRLFISRLLDAPIYHIMTKIRHVIALMA